MALNDAPPPPDPGFAFIGRAEGMSPEVPAHPKNYGEVPNPPRHLRVPLYACLGCGQVVIPSGQPKHRCWEGLC